jgi:leucyl aminopeptidase
MDVRAVSADIATYTADAIIIGLFEGSQAGVLDSSLNGAISELIDGGDFSGKTGQVAVLYPRETIPARRVILVGLGKMETFTADIARRAAASAILKARDLKVSHAAILLDDVQSGALGIEAAAQAVSEGSLMALYSYRGQKMGDVPEALPVSLDVIVDEQNHDRASVGILAGTAIGEGVILARDLVNLPPNFCTPDYLAQTAEAMADEVGLACEILGKTEMETLKMGAILGVAQGSDTPPRFIILEHNAGRDDLETVVLVGKGVTFDTGGYNIKTTEGMGSMKGDMAGGAAVIGAMRALAGLDVPLHVVGLVPASDNMISGHAYRAQEVLTASNGVTIEIISTDAEGRLLLADALVYAGRYNPAAVVDIATLTGACVTALGANVAAGLFSIDDGLRDQLLAAGTSTAEKVWPLPLFPEYDKTIESNTADIKNSGGARGGVGTSAIFLKHFADYPAWAHIDMAGMMFDQPDNPCYPKGATGYGVRLLTEFVRRAAMG